MKARIAFTALLMCCWICSYAQTAINQALAYDILLAKSVRDKGPNKRVNYCEEVVVNGRKQTNVVYVYASGKGLRLKAFIIKADRSDSLIACPEQTVASQKVRQVYERYCARVFRYKKYPRYEYNGSGEEKPAALPAAEPEWVVTAIQVETGKRALKAMFHRMSPAGYEAEDAAIIREMNSDFDAFHKAISEYAQSVGLPLAP